MLGVAGRFAILTLGALLVGCALAHQDTVMGGNADGVVINYFGDIAETLPMARRHCAQYERVPVLRQTKDNNVFYACVRAGTS
jgi:hypothetical protein